MKRDLLTIIDLTAEEVRSIFKLTAGMKDGSIRRSLAKKTIAMVFEKPSLRTRMTFEVGMNQLEGHAVYLTQQDIQLGGRESVADVARNLERWVDGIVARTFKHETIVELARNASIPVINALSDRAHPCQALADLFTVVEKKHDLAGVRIAYIGDGNNVCNSLMLLGATLGIELAVASPSGYRPGDDIIAAASERSTASGAQIAFTDDPREAAQNADVIYTDVWVSMGDEAEADERKRAFARYQVNAELVRAAKPDAVVMHCLPAKRGLEITDEVIDGPQSIVFDQAENRLHVQKALLVSLLDLREDGQLTMSPQL
ncbi:MAG: ornithine carbamoyltransferase [Verrucomicrobia bacterium]|nr:ornithine carbamoyltransferase [Verrucomicrobiota bacterium]